MESFLIYNFYSIIANKYDRAKPTHLRNSQTKNLRMCLPSSFTC